MIIIRKEQLDAFSKKSIEDFKDYVVAFLQIHYEDECEGLDPGAERELVTYGIHVCQAYGITGGLFVRLYIELMVMYGLAFDEDPELPWAQKVLTDESLSQEEAILLLYEHAVADDAGHDELQELSNPE